MSASAISDFSPPATEGTDLAAYRAISRSAILGAVLAGIGLAPLALAFASWKFNYGDASPTGMLAATIGGAAAMLGLIGWLAIRRYPDEYTGSNLALASLLLGTTQLVGGAGMAAHTYATEVPEGYVRTGFWELQADPDYPELPVSKKSIELSGQKVFIKGYMYPGVASTGKVDHFIMIPDLGTCCFGGDPKSTDMIEVHVPDQANRLAYSRRRIKLAGKFGVTQYATQAMKMKNPVWYHLEVDQVR
jgi:hypothetical protein